MIFTETEIAGVYLIDLEPHRDSRGFFARSYCAAEFATRGLPAVIAQESISANAAKGTLRGLHYQAPGGNEAKVVRCGRGSIFDAVVDLRPESPSFRHWIAAELDERNRRAIFIPAGCGHGFQTLAEDTDVYYAMSEAFDPSLARGLRWNDPAFKIPWPIPEPILSEADRTRPVFEEIFA